MKQINFKQNQVKGILRIIGKDLFFKFNDSQYAQNMIFQMQQNGAIINISRTWVRVNIFGDNEYIKLGENEFNVKETSIEEIEQILCDFYAQKYKEAKFEVEIV